MTRDTAKAVEQCHEPNRELKDHKLDLVSGGTKPDGTAKKDKVSGGWNIKQNTAAAA